MLGGLLRPTLHTMATPVAALMFRRTGEQFFLSDEPPGKLPLLVRYTSVIMDGRVSYTYKIVRRKDTALFWWKLPNSSAPVLE